jgi:hypothetical protein
MRTAKLLPALALLTFGTGCGRTMIPFTAELRAEHRLSDADVKNLQFYLSDDITLRRELESGSRQVTGNHRLLLLSGKTVEEVTVAGGTPGVAVSVSDARIAVSFDPGSSLTFSTTGELEAAHEVVKSERRFAEPPDPFPGNEGGDDEQFGGRRASAFGRYLLATDGPPDDRLREARGGGGEREGPARGAPQRPVTARPARHPQPWHRPLGGVTPRRAARSRRPTRRAGAAPPRRLRPRAPTPCGSDTSWPRAARR